MALLLKPALEPASAWIAAFAQLMPALDVRVYPNIGCADDIEFALMTAPPHGLLARLPNLRLVISIPAGLEHLLDDPAFPGHVPLVRCIPPEGEEGMMEFALLHVLRHHRQLPTYAVQQARTEWRKHPQPRTHERRVGVMGLGAVGAAIARTLAAHGFDVAGWARSEKHIDGVRCVAGPAAMADFLARTDILVAVLPATAATKGMLNANVFAQLPRGAQLINLGRGCTLVERDLLAALDSGQLAAATLDVFTEEPLPPVSDLWRHPLITVTPHVGATVRAALSAPVVVDNIRRLHAGEPLLQLHRDAP